MHKISFRYCVVEKKEYNRKSKMKERVAKHINGYNGLTDCIC